MMGIKTGDDGVGQNKEGQGPASLTLLCHGCCLNLLSMSERKRREGRKKKGQSNLINKADEG